MEKSQTPIPASYQALHEYLQNCHLDSNNFRFSGPESFWAAETAKKKKQTAKKKMNESFRRSRMRMALGVASVVLARAASPCPRFLAKCASGLRPVSGSIPMQKMIRIAQHQLIFMNFNLPGQTQNCVCLNVFLATNWFS